ncbi:MAG: cysE [Marmoricola sp.]|nr:cysE [Marmoricola sp.]
MPKVSPSFSELVFSDLLRYREGKPTWLGVLTRCLTLPGMTASIILRAQQCLFRSGHHRLANVMRVVGTTLVGADFTPGMTIGLGLLIPHPNGVTMGNTLVIGNNVTLAQGVTAGARDWEADDPKFPVICDDAALLAGATVLGGVRIGVGAQVGANSLVLADVPDYGIVLGVPARLIGTRDVASQKNAL